VISVMLIPPHATGAAQAPLSANPLYAETAIPMPQPERLVTLAIMIPPHVTGAAQAPLSANRLYVETAISIRQQESNVRGIRGVPVTRRACHVNASCNGPGGDRQG
jgi:hypothetical protein